MSVIHREPPPVKPPSPGSIAAQQAGCRCPVVDNSYGDGFLWNGQRSFWIAGDCPLHATPRYDTQPRETSRNEGD